MANFRPANLQIQDFAWICKLELNKGARQLAERTSRTWRLKSLRWIRQIQTISIPKQGIFSQATTKIDDF